MLPGVTGQDGEQGGAVSARPLGHRLKTTGLQGLLKQRVEVKTPRQKKGLIGLFPLGEFETILFYEKCHSSNNFQVRQKEMSHKTY